MTVLSIRQLYDDTIRNAGTWLEKNYAPREGWKDRLSQSVADLVERRGSDEFSSAEKEDVIDEFARLMDAEFEPDREPA